MVRKSLEIILNILFWVLVTYYITRTFSLETEEVNEYLGGIESISKKYNYKLQYAILATTPFKILLFYFNLLFLSKLLFKKKFLRYALFLLVSIVSLLVFEYFMLTLNCEEVCFLNYIGLGFWLYAFYILISLVYSFFKEYLKDQRLKKELIQERTNAELKLLRSQINPHFLFNALNNLLFIAEREKQKEVSSGIAELSDLLRYMLYDNNQKKVNLNKEIEFIKSYINLNKLRFDEDDPIEISFDVTGDTDDVKIVPALLISFIENSFKHGIDIYETSYIHIKLAIRKNIFTFEVINSLPTTKKNNEFSDENKGIGLENVRRRLQILYPERHSLDAGEEQNKFIVRLKIEL